MKNKIKSKKRLYLFIPLMAVLVLMNVAAFAVAVIYMIPTLLIFLYGEQYLVEGIANSGSVKG